MDETLGMYGQVLGPVAAAMGLTRAARKLLGLDKEEDSAKARRLSVLVAGAISLGAVAALDLALGGLSLKLLPLQAAVTWLGSMGAHDGTRSLAGK